MMSATTHPAVRQHGVCKGTLWRQLQVKGGVPSNSAFSDSNKTCEFCVLVANRLDCYESMTTYQRGDAPVHLLKIVGASAWNPKSDNTTTTVDTSFRIVTDQGTHVYCQAVTPNCRDVWLSTLHAGLEQTLVWEQPTTTTTTLEPPSPQKTMKSSLRVRKYCFSCGAVEGGSRTIVASAAPISHYGKETRCDLCHECMVAQGLLDHLEFIKACLSSAQQERQALQKARSLCCQVMGGHEQQQQEENDDHLSTSTGSSWSQVETENATSRTPSPPDDTNNSSSPVDMMTGSWHAVMDDEEPSANQQQQQQQQNWIHLPPTEGSTKALLDLLNDSSRFGALARVSPVLDSLTQELIAGRIGVPDFLEQLDEAVGQGGEADSLTALKKQAFRVAGDMGTAMKLLLDNALPKHDVENTDMLACILEFLLDLCDEDELSSVAFFWPQLCHIHLRMLPAENAMDLARVDLMEDFLLTIASRYSIHLALELIWSHTADLEESLFSPTCSTSCRRRRFAVLRFVCELESLLFDYEDGWGGGSVSLGKMLSATGHQLELLKGAMIQIQKLRKQAPEKLTRSARIDMLSTSKFDKPPDEAAREKLRIAKNAEYFSGHLNFTKRLCDIAEKLRFMELEKRESALEQELESLNSSGAMGGDPLNRMRDSFLRVVRVPSTEGHVFRSKERTPVLLLMEVTDEGAELPVDNSPEVRSESAADGGEPMPAVASETRSDTDAAEEQDSEKQDEHGYAQKGAGEDQAAGASVPERVLSPAVGETEVLEVGWDEANRSPRALKRFPKPGDSKETPTTPKRDVEAIVSSVAVEHLKGMTLPNLDVPIDATEGEADLDVPIDATEGEADKKGSSPTVKSNEDVDTGEKTQPQSESVAGTTGEEIQSANGAVVEAAEEDAQSPVVQPANDAVVEAAVENVQSPVVQPANDAVAEAAVEDVQLPCEGVARAAQEKSQEPREVTPVAPVDEIQIENEVVAADSGEITRSLGEPVENERHEPIEGIDVSIVRNVSASEASQPSGGRESIREKSGDLRETSNRKSSKKMSTLGSLGSGIGEAGDVANTFSPTGDVRREVLNAIMLRGMQGNAIAAGAADSVQRSLKELERQRATELLMSEDDLSETEGDMSETAYLECESTTQKLASLGIGGIMSPKSIDEEERTKPTEEDEAMEAVRLLLIQNRVAQGHLSPADAAKVLQHTSLLQTQSDRPSSPRDGGFVSQGVSDIPTIDAGDVDARLVGCGPLPPAVLQALTLWKGDMVTNGELLELVKKDIEFVRHSVLLDAENVDKLNENSAFWGRFAFGERWAEKKSRIAASSPESSAPGWDLLGVIVKSNDDLRQEAFVMQLIELCEEAFELAGLELWVSPYRILATGRTTGVIEMVRNAMSFDSLKKRPGYGKGGLREHLQRMTEFTADPGGAFKSAQRNFVHSLAAYSLMSYFFLFKDRHNGNILVDTAGHVIHIDFGFVFGVAPGGSFSLEMSTPFKLTEEMLEVMGGLRSPLFSEFVTLFCCGFLALQSYCDTFLTIVEITSKNSTFKCFDGRDTDEIVNKMRERFVPDFSKEQTVAFALDLIKQATTSYGTRQYDLFQYLSQGIAA